MVQQYKLKNNLSVILVPQKDTQSTTTLVMYPVGSRYEPEKLAGVSHYIEHLMFKGTKKRKSAQLLTREIDRLGAEYNAFTSKEYTGYYIKAGAEYLDISLDILSDMLFQSVFDPKEMEREKGPIIEELRMYADNPIMNIDTIFENLLYAGCPLGRDIGGTVKHVQSYQRDDVLAYRDKYYVPSNMTIVVAGNLPVGIESRIEQFFGQEPNTKKPSRVFKPGVFASAKKQDRIVVEKKQTDQAQLMLGFPGFEIDDMHRAIVGKVLTTILGGSMSSRLFTQIRERRGLAYTVRAGREAYRDTGYYYVRAGLEPKNINKAIEVISAEIEKLCSKGVTGRELRDAKTHITGGQVLSLEDSSVQANWYAQYALFHSRIWTPQQIRDAVNTVTQAEVQQLAQEIFALNQMRVGIIGSVEQADVVF